MKKFFYIFLLLFLSACVQPQFEQAFVERVIDGDTIFLSTQERVRLIGINAPEKNQACFEESFQMLKLLIEQKNISMLRDISEKDKYGRLLRYVFVENENINLIMVQKGFAFSFPFEPDVKFVEQFNNAELVSKKSGNGCLWKK